MLKVGHRGAPAHAPENTLLSFRTALAMGCDALELDIQQSKDGTLVVIHDRDLPRTTNGRGLVAERTEAELRALDAGEGERIPLLEEVLNEFKNKATLFLEIKSKTQAAAEALAHAVEAAVENGWARERLVVIGFHPEVLAWVRAAAPDIPLGLTYEKAALASLPPFVQALKPAYLNPPITQIDETAMAFARSHGMKVAVWTVKTAAQAAKARALGVDAAMADDPRLVTRD